LRVQKIPKLSNLSPEFGYVTNVYTRPEWRGQGIGAQVMEEAKAWAKAAGLEMFVLWPAEGREAFYQRAGFHPDESLQLDFDA
ncbi:MAG TPA: GNAT family N-acetyltransferase, partial [Anaerolineaceae bacterium]|nr:GNAT family N-acetyltransferase [Anaerolineaceae bacterium]